jgi:hypothetical protein
MPVTFDSSGSNSEFVTLSTSGSMSWTHNVSPTATNTVALVGVLWSGPITITGTFSVSFGGSAMTQIGTAATWTPSTMALYSLASPPSGSNTVTVSYSGMTSSIWPTTFGGVSASYWGVQAIGAPVTASGGTTTNNGVTVASTLPAWKVVSIHGNSDGWDVRGLGTYTGTQRASTTQQILGLGGYLMVGDVPGNSSVTPTVNQQSTARWGAIGVNLTPATVYGTAAATFSVQQAFSGSLHRVQTPSPLRTWAINA